MPNYFFDTSALVKAYHREAGTERVMALVAEQGEPFANLLIECLGLPRIAGDQPNRPVIRGMIRDSDP